MRYLLILTLPTTTPPWRRCLLSSCIKNLISWDSKSIGTRSRYRPLNRFRVPRQWSYRPWPSSGGGILVYIPQTMYWTRWWEWCGYPQTNGLQLACACMKGTEPWNLAHVYLINSQPNFVCIVREQKLRFLYLSCTTSHNLAIHDFQSLLQCHLPVPSITMMTTFIITLSRDRNPNVSIRWHFRKQKETSPMPNKEANPQHMQAYTIVNAPPLIGGALSDAFVWRLASVCLSVCLSRTSGVSPEQRGLRRPKLAQR